MGNKLWEVHEKEIVYIYYPDTKIKDFKHKLPNRTTRSIRNMANRMGLNKSYNFRREQGLKFFKDNYVDYYPEMTKEYLEEEYVNKRRSTTEIARYFNCKNDVILKRLKRHGLPVRKDSSYYTVEERKEKFGRRGSEHHNWKGGITDLSILIRNNIYHVVRERFKMDGFKCTECGGGEHFLHAHHIVPFSEIVDDIRKENGLEKDLTTWEDKANFVDICSEDERLLDVHNLITYCEDCHIEEHRRLRILDES